MSFVARDVRAGDQYCSVSCGFADPAGTEAAVTEQSCQLPPGVLVIEMKVVSETGIPCVPTARMDKERSDEKRMILRIRKWHVFRITSIRVKDVEQSAGLARDERCGVAGSVREHRPVRSAASSRSGHLQTGPRRCGSRQADGDFALTRRDNGAGVQSTATRVMDVRLDRPANARANRPVERRIPRRGKVPCRIWNRDPAEAVRVGGADGECVQGVTGWKNAAQ